MSKSLKIFLILVVLAAAGLYIYTRYNHSSFRPDTIDLRVDCSKVSNAILTSLVAVRVSNLSSRIHNNVTVEIKAYDKNGNLVKDKDVTFDRPLNANEALTKLVTLPARTKTCNCTVVHSDPQ